MFTRHHDIDRLTKKLLDLAGTEPGESWRQLVLDTGVHPDYLISSHGRVLSLPRMRNNPRGPVLWPGKVIKASKLKNGHQRFSVRDGGKSRTVLVHRAVVRTFVGASAASSGITHVDGDPSNNALSNLSFESSMPPRTDEPVQRAFIQTQPSPVPATTHPATIHPATSRETSLDLGSANANLLIAYLHRFDRERTQRAYWNDLRRFFGTEHVNRELAQRATFLHVNEHIAEMERNDQKASTIKRRIAAIRGFYDWLLALELVERNPANRQLLRRVRRVSARDRVVFYLSAEQASALVAAAAANARTGVRDQALVQTLLHCVLRRSEAAAMDVEHIRPLGSFTVLDIPQAKGGADQYVKIPDHIDAIIHEYRNEFNITTGPLWRSFSNNSYGNRLSAHAIYRIVTKAAEDAGLPTTGAHTLRHTGCTLAIEAGATIQQVQAHARHKSIDTTMTYVHQRDRLRDSAADFIRVTDADAHVDDKS